MNRFNFFKVLFLAFFVPSLMASHQATAQNLVYDGDFSLAGLGWTTSCVSVEAWGYESTYGGPSTTNHVAEIDDEACMHQDICILPGYSYIYSMDATRRTAGGPNPCTTHITITGLNGSGAVVSTFVNMDFVRTNTVFALTPVTGIPVISVPACSGVVRLRIELTDNTPGYSTLGMIVDNISLTYVTPPAIAGPSVTCQYIPGSYSVPGAPGCLDYMWLFGPASSPASSTLSAPAAFWSTPGSKSIVLALGNGVCNDTLQYTVTVNGAVRDTIHPIACSQPFTFHGITYMASGIYTDTLVAPAGCDSIITIMLTVNPRPAPPVVTPVSYCQSDATASLSATGSALLWFGPGITSGSVAAPVPGTATSGIDSYYVTQTVGGCTSDSALALVFIRPLPVSPMARDTGYCQYQVPAQLTATGDSLRWYNVNTGGLPLAVTPAPVTSTQGVYTWYVSQVANGCESVRTPVHVTVAPEPDVHITTNHTDVCLYDTVKLAFSGTGTVSALQWSFPSDDILLAGSHKGHALSLMCSNSGVQMIYLKVVDSQGICAATDSLKLNIIPTPSAEITTPNGVCLGDTVTLALAAHSANAATYTWFINNTPLFQSPFLNVLVWNANTGGPYEVSWNTAGRYRITMYTETKEGCRSPLMADSVKVSNLPDPSFTVNTQGPLCLEDSVSFQAAETGFGYLYQWSPGQYFNNINQPFAWGKKDAVRTRVTLTVTDAFGCAALSSQELDPSLCCRIDLPGAFTPNGDGRNDVFRPVVAGFHRFHKFTIVNRWGQVVFESANSNFEWDGNFNGVPQEMDVYYYLLSYDCGGNTIVQKGDVTLIR